MIFQWQSEGKKKKLSTDVNIISNNKAIINQHTVIQLTFVLSDRLTVFKTEKFCWIIARINR